jgi:hypothetical protein
MNSNNRDRTLASIHEMLDGEESLDDMAGGGGPSASLENSMSRFAREAELVNRRQGPDHSHDTDPNRSVDLRAFPNADFYYKLVAKVNNRLYSIYDGETEYVIG